MGEITNFSSPLSFTEQHANFCFMRCTGIKSEGPHSLVILREKKTEP